MFNRIGTLSLCLVALSYVLAGCGMSNDVIKEDPAVAKKKMDAAVSLRSYFDKSNGNFDSLSEEDKAAVIKLQGSEANAREAFSHMVPSKPAGASSTGTTGGNPADMMSHNGPQGGKVGH
ncbi:MAG TPA: hypothetical protein VKT78_08995 [Fimbriimonadaceae bacterium]|nr:hypothetical protein [Fimbriimonadaceae bacterium]